MTLITYPTRVHFADDVLEEALRAELERAEVQSAFLTLPAHLRRSALAERVRAGLPVGMAIAELTLPAAYDTVVDLSGLARSGTDGLDTGALPDVVLAYGSAQAIELGRKCRRLLSEKMGRRLPFFAVPGADGLPNPCMRNVESWSSGLPTVLICDPTVTLGTTPSQNQRSAVLSMVRCVEAYLAVAYNPPADGIALEGIHLCIETLPRLKGVAGIELQREVMAGCLNAALSQEKGLGRTLTLAAALAGASRVEEADAAGLLLPEVIRRHPAGPGKEETLARLFGTGAGEALSDAMGRMLAQVPFSSRLSEMGVTEAGLDRAARASAYAGLSYDEARSILATVF